MTYIAPSDIPNSVDLNSDWFSRWNRYYSDRLLKGYHFAVSRGRMSAYLRKAHDYHPDIPLVELHLQKLEDGMFHVVDRSLDERTTEICRIHSIFIFGRKRNPIIDERYLFNLLRSHGYKAVVVK